MTPLKQYCDANGISSHQLGKLCGVSQPSAYRWMHGQTHPTMHHIAVITKISGGEVNALSFVPDLEMEDVSTQP